MSKFLHFSGTFLQNHTGQCRNYLTTKTRVAIKGGGEGPRDRGYDRDWAPTAGSHFSLQPPPILKFRPPRHLDALPFHALHISHIWNRYPFPPLHVEAYLKYVSLSTFSISQYPFHVTQFLIYPFAEHCSPQKCICICPFVSLKRL